MAGSDTDKDEDYLADAKQALQDAKDFENENRVSFIDDTRFARLGEQWPEAMRRQRELDARPCLTANMLPSYIRHVINNARQNKPGIVVHPVDSQADPATADILNGLIRQIEQSSDAEVAYDTALDNAVTGGWGYFKINTRYATDDTFDQDIIIEAVANPLSIYGDPHSTAADSSDWMRAFELDQLSKAAFKLRWKDADAVSFDNPTGERSKIEDEQITIASDWTREEVAKQIVAVSMPEADADPAKVMTAMALGVSDKLIVDLETFEQNADLYKALGMNVVGSPRAVPSFKVTQRILSGCDVLETIDWAGKYIPIIPVYGEDVNIEGVRHLRSLIRDGKDLQRMFNFWRTASTEMVALAPKAPFIGRKGAFQTDAAKWATMNVENWSYVEYDGAEAPQRQPFAGVPAGIMQEATSAAEDMKAILGIFNAQGEDNEASGRAILARQKQADIGSFHFIDNLSRGIRHGGRVILDLIPKVYSTQRVIRIVGQDGTQQAVKIGPAQPQEQQPGPAIQPGSAPPMQGASPAGSPVPPQGAPQPMPMGQPGMPPPAMPGPSPMAPAPPLDPQMLQQVAAVERIFDLTVGKYDLTVQAGPAYSTLREELNTVLMELVRAYPPAAPAIMDLIVKTLDIPDADEVADRIQQMAQGTQGADPKAQQAVQQLQSALEQAHGQVQQWQQKAQAAAQDAEAAKNDNQLKGYELQLKARELDIKDREAQTNQLQAQTDAQRAHLEGVQQAREALMPVAPQGAF